MIYLHGLIALLLAAFFASPALAQTSPDTCTEYRVPDIDNMTGGVGQSVTGKGWQLSEKAAYVGSVYTTRDACYVGTNTVKDWSAANGCLIATTGSTHNGECAPMNTSPPAAWSNCGSSGFGLDTRSVDKEPFDQMLDLGYFYVGEHTGEDMDAFGLAAAALVGQKICIDGKRHVITDSENTDVKSDRGNCYTVNGKEKCMLSALYKLTPTCEACQVGDKTLDTKPAIPDTDGDGDPDNTDPDADGDGKPDNGGGDPGGGDPGGGDPGGGDPGGSGTDTDGDGIPDSTDTDDDGDGCLDVNEPCTGTDPGGGDGTGDGDGDGQCDPQTQDCSPTGGSFGGDCMAGFTCSGDAIQCAIAREMHRMNCKLFGDDKDGNSLFNKAKEGTDGFSMNELREKAEKISIGSFNQAGFGWGRACPADPTIPLGFAGGAEITIPFSRVCGVLGVLSLAGVGITLLGCMVWVLSGTSKS